VCVCVCVCACVRTSALTIVQGLGCGSDGRARTQRCRGTELQCGNTWKTYCECQRVPFVVDVFVVDALVSRDKVLDGHLAVGRLLDDAHQFVS
jgi:hypothetical protein